MKYLLVLLLCVPASAERVRRSGTGNSGCKSVKVLVIGGELQPNTWDNCGSGGGKEDHSINSDWYKNKVAGERDEYKHKQEGERAKRKDKSEREHEKARGQEKEHGKDKKVRETKHEDKHEDRARKDSHSDRKEVKASSNHNDKRDK